MGHNMKTSISLIISTLLCISFFSVQAQTPKEKGLPEGKTFTITLRTTGETRPGMPWTTDVISFSGGKLDAKVMRAKEKFPPFNCSFTVDSASSGVTIHFTASGHNSGTSDIAWEGTIAGSKIEGTAVWTNANGPQTYSFSGKSKGEK